MQVESIAIRFRPRTALEAADLGGRICLDTAAATYSCYFLVAVPVIAMALASVQIAPWLPALAIWSAKPWLDRTILFVLSRAAFGQTTRPGDLWRARREVWWRQWLFMWVIGRLSPWRSVTQPVYQLEGLPIRRASARIRQIRKRNMSAGLMMGAVFSLSELTLTIALLSLVFWFAPSGRATGLMEMLFGDAGTFALVFPSAYAASVLFLEPFYVAAGFAMYLNRRADLEAWDIEQELRRAFAH